MVWSDNLTRQELIDHIEVFRGNLDFARSRDRHLERAVYEKDIELVELLLRAGAGPDYTQSWGDSLLHHLAHEYESVRTTQGSVVLRLTELLLSHGANPEHVGCNNWRAIDYCIEHGTNEMVALFVRYGADPVQREFI